MKCTSNNINQLRTVTLVDGDWQYEFWGFIFDAKAPRRKEKEKRVAPFAGQTVCRRHKRPLQIK
jgi:hypothetical protein